jgi:hypothetical protein
MRTPTTAPADAYAPDADRAGIDAPAQPPEWLVRALALLLFFLQEPINAVRMLRFGRLTPWWHDRPDLPAGSAQAYFASVRGNFGTSIRWMCIRHGIGPGHKDWPEVSRAIVAYGGSLDGFWAGAPPKGLKWWEIPGVIPGAILVPGFSAFAPAAVVPLEQRIAENAAAPTAAANVVQAVATHARLPASWLAASRQHVFARAGPGFSTGPPNCPVLLKSIMFDARGRSMASPAILIPAE